MLKELMSELIQLPMSARAQKKGELFLNVLACERLIFCTFY